MVSESELIKDYFNFKEKFDDFIKWHCEMKMNIENDKDCKNCEIELWQIDPTVIDKIIKQCSPEPASRTISFWKSSNSLTFHYRNVYQRIKDPVGYLIG